MGKFELVLLMCSIVAQDCAEPKHQPHLYQSHFDCAAAGYILSGEYFSQFDENVVNEQKLAIKFECKDLDIT